MALDTVENRSFGRPARPGIIQSEPVLWPSPRLMKALAAEIVGGYEQSPWGGVEVGGVLFGTKEPDGVHISSYRPLETEHRHGPSFDLSDRDFEALNRLLADARNDDLLKGLVPVGWYHSVSNREIFMSKNDVAVHDYLFSEPWQVAMILKRSQRDPVVVGFSFRQDNGSIPAQPRYTYTLDDVRSEDSIAQIPERAVRQRPRFETVYGRLHSIRDPKAPDRNAVSIPNDLLGQLRYE